MRIAAILFLLSSVALAEGSKSVTLSDAVKLLFTRRAALTYGQGEFHNLAIPAVKGTNTLSSYSSEFDVLFPLSLHLGFRETLTQSADISFNGSPSQRGEIYLTVLEIGPKLFIPLGRFQPFVGAGYLYGSAAFTNPRTRGNDSYLAAFENETHSLWGHYYQAGADIFFTETLGIRAYYQQDDINVERYYNLQTTGNNFFMHRRWAVGFVSLTP